MTDIPYSTSGHLGSTKMIPRPISTSVLTSDPTPSPFPWESEDIQVHTILIIIIFCVVCFLLLVAFFYAFCFRCTLEPPPKDPRPAHGCSLDREDATFRRSSSDGQSVANVV